MQNKKAAVELSIGTIVIIVLAMTMLVLGLVLVRDIFTGATASVDSLNEKVRQEISRLFSDEDQNIVVYLGREHTAKIKQGTESFYVAIGARTPDGSSTDRNRLKYKLSFDKDGDCIRKLGAKQAESLLRARFKFIRSSSINNSKRNNPLRPKSLHRC